MKTLLSDKEIKEKFRPRFWNEPDRYYPTSFLKSEGFERKICIKCGKPFWSIEERSICGDPICGSNFDFINNSPAKNKLNFVEVWKKFSEIFSKLGYTPIKRYPTVSRWNPTMEYTNASIAAFQPYVISGEVEPPANPLVIPQFCLRFTDVDNVGITGSHHTGFVMMGQHAFVEKEKWDQEKYFSDIYKWLMDGLKIDKKEIIFHEDAWAGGGDFGCCIEFFSRGCEIGNQVYMLYTQTQTGYKDLPIRVLDMGSGQERNAWFSLGTFTIYDSAFPFVLRKIFDRTGIKIDEDFQKRIAPYRGKLNVDEVKNIDLVWIDISNKLGYDVNELKKKIEELAAVYSIAEHFRTLLISINDGAIPSNTGGGYNLRAIFRRALSFSKKYNIDIEIEEILAWHANELKEQYPELSENLELVAKILNVEKKKYEQTIEKGKAISIKLLEEGIDEEKLIKLYDSHGITPDVLKENLQKIGVEIKIPEDFYVRVAELHEKVERKKEIKREEDIDLTGIPETVALYFDDYKKDEFTARVLKVDGEKVVLDQTLFYPTSGGQVSDTGRIGNCRVYEVIKIGPHIIHKVEKPNFKVGDIVNGKIDLDRRVQIAQHHTAAHLINYAARKVLGKHVNQAGAYKDEEKGRLDITHFESLTSDEIKKIEEEANRIISLSLPVESKFMSRRSAEDKYGMQIYQGPAVPGRILRIVSIPGIDTEACGGTHVHNTSELEKIIITKTLKISDSVVRIEYKAGAAARKEIEENIKIIKEVADVLNLSDLSAKNIISKVNMLFTLWKKSEKLLRKSKEKAISKEELEEIKNLAQFQDNIQNQIDESEVQIIISELSNILRTQKENIPKTVRKFRDQLFSNIKRIGPMV